MMIAVLNFLGIEGAVLLQPPLALNSRRFNYTFIK